MYTHYCTTMFDFSKPNIPIIPIIIPITVDYKYYCILINYSYLISISLYEFVVQVYILYDMSYFFLLLSVYNFYGSNGIKTGPYTKNGEKSVPLKVCRDYGT
jgi:hypothetical protein